MLKPPAILRAEADEEHGQALAAVRQLARRCAAELAATSVLLFGSRARANWHRSSDCDVIVVSDAFAGMSFSGRWNAIYERWSGGVDLNPIGMTAAEFELGKDGAGIVAMALADGVIELLELAKPESRPVERCPGTSEPRL